MNLLLEFYRTVIGQAMIISVNANTLQRDALERLNTLGEDGRGLVGELLVIEANLHDAEIYLRAAASSAAMVRERLKYDAERASREVK